jgi:hypothetical protein
MAKTSTNVINLQYSPDTVLKAVTDPAFQEKNFKAQGNPDAKVEVVSKSDDRLVLKANVTEYAKGVTGVDKSRTEQTTTTFEWDLRVRKATWTYDSPHGDRVHVKGDVQIEPQGDGSRVTENFSVDVKIPLMGGKIEKMVIKEAESYYPKYEKLLKEHCQKLVES